MYGFEVLVHDTRLDDDEPHECTERCRWSADACGHQGPDNYLSTREEAIAQLPSLAEALSSNGEHVPVEDVRVVEID